MSITGRTKILALIADPVAQARSPGLATTMLQERGRFGEFVLLPMQVPADGLAAVVAAVRQIQNFAGAIVSMPHKTTITALLDELSDEARLVGAVNVFRRTAEARLIGTALDGEGFVAGLSTAGHQVAGTACLLVGAGGAASSIAFALARHGCRSLAIVNRTGPKAARLAEAVQAAFPAVAVRTADIETGHYDIAINGTSLGMNAGDALPMSPRVIEQSALIAECVLAPEMTRLLEAARDRGRAIHTGMPMLTGQMDLILRFMGVD